MSILQGLGGEGKVSLREQGKIMAAKTDYFLVEEGKWPSRCPNGWTRGKREGWIRPSREGIIIRGRKKIR